MAGTPLETADGFLPALEEARRTYTFGRTSRARCPPT